MKYSVSTHETLKYSDMLLFYDNRKFISIRFIINNQNQHDIYCVNPYYLEV